MMFEFRQTAEFTQWTANLRDRQARSRVAQRLLRVQSGLLGDVKYFDGIGEMRIDYGPGYRIYFVRRGQTVIFLLCGGDKSSQNRDIDRAKALAKEIPYAD